MAVARSTARTATVTPINPLSAMMQSGDYPTTWDEYIGQDLAKRQLMIAAKSARMRKVPMDHTLIMAGDAGVGKSALALLAAKELGSNVKAASGKIGLNEARILLAGMHPCDVLFIDEIHTLVSGGKAKAEEWILHLLQDGALMGPRGLERVAPITVIGTTTDAGRLPKTIRSRFLLKPQLVPISDDDAFRIAMSMAARMFPAGVPIPSVKTAEEIAQACGNNPRAIRALLSNLRDIALATDGSNVKDRDKGIYDITEAMEWAGVTSDGLTRLAVRYLTTLLTEFSGQAGGKTMMDRMNEPGGLEDTEFVLMEHGLLMKTRTGRQLTGEGIRRAVALAEAAEEDE